MLPRGRPERTPAPTLLCRPGTPTPRSSRPDRRAAHHAPALTRRAPSTPTSAPAPPPSTTPSPARTRPETTPAQPRPTPATTRGDPLNARHAPTPPFRLTNPTCSHAPRPGTHPTHPVSNVMRGTLSLEPTPLVSSGLPTFQWKGWDATTRRGPNRRVPSPASPSRRSTTSDTSHRHPTRATTSRARRSTTNAALPHHARLPARITSLPRRAPPPHHRPPQHPPRIGGPSRLPEGKRRTCPPVQGAGRSDFRSASAAVTSRGRGRVRARSRGWSRRPPRTCSRPYRGRTRGR